MDNNEVYALFEDIRNGLKGINDKLVNEERSIKARKIGLEKDKRKAL